MILDPNDPACFDKWREMYDILSFEEHVRFANECEVKFPTQVHHDWKSWEPELLQIRGKVIEIGGWKGEMAVRALNGNPKILSWLNMELSTNAIEKSVCKDPRYKAHQPYKFDWFTDFREEHYDVAISAHSIEHLSDDDCLDLVNYLSGIQTIILEAPIQLNGDDFRGYCGTHRLSIGWAPIVKAFEKMGYVTRQINPIMYRWEMR